MKKKIVYTDEPLGRFERIMDLLPSPEKMVLKEKNVRVTLNLSSYSVDFFKKLGKRHRVPYQKLIRRALDEVASHTAL